MSTKKAEVKEQAYSSVKGNIRTMYSNVVYGHDEWATHKSPWRHCRHFVTILSSGLIRAIAPPVLMSTAVALLVSVTNHGIQSGGWFPNSIPLLTVGAIPFSLTAPVLALLLVFRTNSSFHRFDEARRVWGSTVTRSRDLARQSLAWIRHPSDTEKLSCLLRYIKALSFTMKHHLIRTSGMREELALILENHEEVESVVSATNRPLYVLQVISEIINQCQVTNWEKVTMDKNITQCHDNLGVCDRIFKTPIPVAYTRLVSRVLSLWHLVLPFAIWESCGWVTVVASFFSSAALFYIEQVGVIIEEPFSILALESMAKGILAGVDALVGAHTDALILAWTCRRTYEEKVPETREHVVINLKCPSLNDVENKGGAGAKVYIRSLSVSQLQSIPSSSIDI